MKRVKLSIFRDGTVTMGSPYAGLGYGKPISVSSYKIDVINVPDEVPFTKVVRIFDSICYFPLPDTWEIPWTITYSTLLEGAKTGMIKKA